MAILSYVHEIQTVYNVVQNPQMILLSEKERMVSVPGVKRSACCCLKVHTLQQDPVHVQSEFLPVYVYSHVPTVGDRTNTSLRFSLCPKLPV